VDAAAFAAWLLTALGGFVLFATWFSGEGARAGDSRFAPRVVFGHLGLAAVGLLAWIVHLVARSAAAAWVSALVLVPLVALGLVLLAAWLEGRPAAARAEATATRPAEQWLPSSVVVLHGVGALVTVVLVVVAVLTS
jgi:hypothetical protein